MTTNFYLRFTGCLFLLGSWLLAIIAPATSVAVELPPQIQLIGNGQVITNGDLLPRVEDHTYFGETPMDTPIVHSFTITNAGFGPLILTGTPLVTVSRDYTGRFVVTSPPDSFVPAGGNTTFQVTFTPDGFGNRVATLSIASNDSNNPSYTFWISGFVPGCISNITVLNNNDNGLGSLRQACLELCAGGRIDFTNTMRGQTIVLTNGEISRAGALTLMGPGAPNLTISGNGNSRVFSIIGTVAHVLSGLTIANGWSLGPGGGGLINNFGSTLVLQECVLTNNKTAGNGGAIYNQGSKVFINNCTLAGNSADVHGGGIFNSSGHVIVSNSTFGSNRAAQTGGGIYNSIGIGTLILSHCTFNGNAASAGGGVYNSTIGFMSLSHTLLAKGTNGRNLSISGSSVTNLGFNLSDDDSGGIPNAGNLLLGPLASNGGPTLTHALLPGSPAIDAGANMAPSDLLYDQRGPGFQRLVNGRMDVGAYERQAPAFIQAYWETQGFRSVVRSEPNETLQIQWNAQPGAPGWNPLTSGSTDAAGLLQFTDTDTNGEPRRFYRAIRP